MGDSTYIFRRGKVEPVPADSATEECARKSEVVILGVPTDSYKMDPSWIKEGAIVVNVASHKNIDEVALLTTRPGVRFVPQVGKVTIAMLERNLLRLHGNFAGCEKLIWDSALGCVVSELSKEVTEPGESPHSPLFGVPALSSFYIKGQDVF